MLRTAEPFKFETEAPEVTYQCLVGGKPVKTVIGPHSINIMSRAKFRELRNSNIIFFNSTMVPTTIEQIDFLGQFATKIAYSDRKVSFATIFVREGNEDYLLVNRQTADILKI